MVVAVDAQREGASTVFPRQVGGRTLFMCAVCKLRLAAAGSPHASCNSVLGEFAMTLASAHRRTLRPFRARFISTRVRLTLVFVAQQPPDDYPQYGTIYIVFFLGGGGSDPKRVSDALLDQGVTCRILPGIQL